jgi:hypothetical protein
MFEDGWPFGRQDFNGEIFCREALDNSRHDRIGRGPNGDEEDEEQGGQRQSSGR